MVVEDPLPVLELKRVGHHRGGRAELRDGNDGEQAAEDGERGYAGLACDEQWQQDKRPDPHDRPPADKRDDYAGDETRRKRPAQRDWTERLAPARRLDRGRWLIWQAHHQRVSPNTAQRPPKAGRV